MTPPEEASLIEDLATEIYTAIAGALEVAVETFKEDIAAIFTKARLFQWLGQFPASLGTIMALILIALLDLVRNFANAIPQGIAQGAIFTVIDRIPVGNSTVVCTQEQAIQGALNLFADSIRATASSSTPIEVTLGLRIKNSGSWLRLIRKVMAGAFDTILAARFVRVLKAALVSLVRLTVTIGAAIVLISMAFYWANAIQN
jgi:hypothetical protein